jgi:hypothetical protein
MADFILPKRRRTTKPTVKAPGNAVSAKLRRTVSSFVCDATNCGAAIGSRLMLPRVPKGARGVKQDHRRAHARRGDARDRHHRHDRQVRRRRDLHRRRHADVDRQGGQSRGRAGGRRRSVPDDCGRRAAERRDDCRRDGIHDDNYRARPPACATAGGLLGAGRPSTLSPEVYRGRLAFLPGGDAGAMLTYVPIGNTALQHLGEADRIVDPTRTASRRAQSSVAWEPTRLFVLAEAHWSFASAPSSSPPALMTPTMADRPRPQGVPAPADLVSFIEIVEPCSLDEEDSYSIEAGRRGPRSSPTKPGRSRPLRPRRQCGRRSGALAAGLHRSLRLPPRLADQRRARADKARKDRALGASEKALKLARRANARTKAARRHATTPWTAARRAASSGRRAP